MTLSKKIIAIAVAAVIILGSFTAAFLTKGFGLFAGPLDGLFKAVKNTVKAESASVKITVSGEGANYIISGESELKTVIDKEKKNLTFLVELTNKLTNKNFSNTFLFNDGSVYYLSDNDAYYYESETDQIETVFDAYDAVFNNKKDTDWGEILETLEIDEYVYEDNVEDFIKSFYKDYLCNKKWLEETIGFKKTSKSGITTYSFEGDLKDLMKEMLDILEDAEVCNKSFLNDRKEELEYMDVDFKISLSVKGGKLHSGQAAFEMDDTNIDYEIEVYDIGKTEITKDEIDDIENKVDAWIKEHT